MQNLKIHSAESIDSFELLDQQNEVYRSLAVS